MKKLEGRRPETTRLVMPSSSNSKWRVGSRYGEFRIGFSMTSAIRACAPHLPMCLMLRLSLPTGVPASTSRQCAGQLGPSWQSLTWQIPSELLAPVARGP